ncbi:ABC transporter ATP-binding protein [Candidatus Haliotispira prima]|uniref:ABC transporter ATP-binding protein n=1 Tax=Candidatus Haliotispira prima TaxID=3034016 RepID=A0ABY8MJH9_9SPIO|nr:ABC transporter ATP-binding protein [Candidatus Haliotispira prima]
MSHHIVEAKDVYFQYPGQHKAVDGISFRILHGESVGIIGANGAGKSTLLLLLMGVLFPDNGEISIGEVPITKKNLGFVRQQMGMMMQDPDDQLFMATVEQDVAFGPRNMGLDETAVQMRVTTALAKAGVPHLAERSPQRLSGGEKRAVALATVLAMEPDILILDEPTSFLDPKSRRRFINLLQTFHHTKIITTHDLDMTCQLCERIIIVKGGKIMADGDAATLLTDEELLDSCGLEIPLSLQDRPIFRSRLRPENQAEKPIDG